MLNHFKHTLTKLFARGKEGIEVNRVRGSLELLEDRTMLSASHGMMAHNLGGANSSSYGGAGSQKFSNSAAFVSQQQQQQRPKSYDSQSLAGVRQSGPAPRDDQSYATMQSAFPTPQRISGGGLRRLPEPGWNQFVAAPPDNAYSYHSPPGASSYISSVTSEPTYTVTYYYIEYLTTNVSNNQSFNYAKPNDFVPATALGLKSTQNGPGGLVGDVADLRRTGQRDNHVQPPPPPNYGGKLYDTTLPLNYVLANVVSTTSDLPIASQMLSRETSTVAALNAVARDIALQEFSANLYQSNTTTAYDRVNVDTLGQDTTQSEVVDGLIHPTDESTHDVIANSSDAVIHEREAVDAVLEDLHDIDSLLPTTESQDLKFKTDLQTETALDELPAGEVDGGMVLLQSTGDANGNGFDLTQVYAEHVGRFSAPAKMETSVGMFQAVDVGSDEAPIVESVPQNESTTQFNRETKLDDKLSTKREQSSSKAAAVIGATTLTLALVWLNRTGSRFTRAKTTAQKRPVFRS